MQARGCFCVTQHLANPDVGFHTLLHGTLRSTEELPAARCGGVGGGWEGGWEGVGARRVPPHFLSSQDTRFVCVGPLLRITSETKTG